MFVMLNVVMLNGVMLNVVLRLNVVMMNVNHSECHGTFLRPKEKATIVG